MKSFVATLGLFLAASAAPTSSQPTAKVLNGTYTGVHSDAYKQDFFLGIPYAQQPVGNLRFTVPQSLNDSWGGQREATDYSPICVGYGTDSIWYPVSEECLTLNVVRGSQETENSKLPVAVWIHGGGFTEGSSADQRYNMSAIVEQSYEIGKPFIAVSINYRLAAWGFLYSQEVLGSGNTNLGLRDQRLALHWIKENIHAFGGDPTKVVIWGESAGGMSVGMHLTAYGGRDDGLFRGGIMESGGSVTATPMNSSDWQAVYDGVVEQANCAHAIDTLQCLRELPYETLNPLLNSTVVPAVRFYPYVDGDILPSWGSVSLNQGRIVKVPILSGTNTDEGSAFGPVGINTTEQFSEYLTTGQSGYPPLPAAAAQRILDLYPDDPSQGIPEFLGDARVPAMGEQWRRTSAFAGDLFMHSERRRQCEVWASHAIPAYCYRFNVHQTDVPLLSGVTHFEEISFVFKNFDGLGYHYGMPFNHTPPSYKQLSTVMASMWASFIHDLDPNTGVADLIGNRWPQYETAKPMDFVFDANVTSYAEADTWRQEGIAYLNEIAAALYH